MDHDIFSKATHERPITVVHSYDSTSSVPGEIRSEYWLNVPLCRTLPYEYVYRGIKEALDTGVYKVSLHMDSTTIMSLGYNSYSANPTVDSMNEDGLYIFIRGLLNNP